MSTREFARKIAKEVVAEQSFLVWQNRQFRDLANFRKITNKEQDKIFNELELTALTYVLFFLEERLKKHKNDQNYITYINIKELIVGEFIALMDEAGIAGKHLSLWNSLIFERVEACREDMEFVTKESSRWEVFKGEDRFLRPTWARIITMSIVCLRHVRANEKAALKDPLWTYLRKWLINLEVELIRSFKDADFNDLYVLN